MADEVFGFTLTPQLENGSPVYNNDATAKNPIGSKIRWKGNTYRYVKFDNGTSNVASAAKGAAHWKTLTPTTSPPVATVTSDQTDACFGVNGVAGIFLGVITDQYYGWIQVGGQAQVTAGAGTVEGDQLVGGTTDLQLERIASGSNLTNKLVGIVKEGSTSGGPTVLLVGMDW